MTQQIINYGAVPNDGTGDPLRTAFIKTDDNFDQIWASGPVGSNITILNNTVGVSNTNGNLILGPNGIGVVQVNNHVMPRANRTYDLGSSSLQYRSVYANSINTTALTVAGNIAANYIVGNGHQLTGIVSWVTAPVSNTASGTAGQAAYDVGGNLYVCVGANNWAKFSGTTSW